MFRVAVSAARVAKSAAGLFFCDFEHLHYPVLALTNFQKLPEVIL